MFICKPEAGCQGKGIFIARKIEELQSKIERNFKEQKTAFEQYLRQEEMYDTAQKYGSTRQQSFYQQDLVLEPEVFQRDHSYVVQKYLKAPALWLEHKFDFRIYVLVTSVVDPMTIYLYNDGLVRLASEKYQGCSNHHDAFVHLTNYSLNKKNNNFDDVNHKLRLKDCLQGTLTQPPSKPGKEGATRQAADIWAEIESIVVKTVLTVQP